LFISILFRKCSTYSRSIFQMNNSNLLLDPVTTIS
jgi:hypothetical protein